MNIADIYKIVAKLEKNLSGDYSFRPDNVYREGSEENRKHIGDLCESLLLPGSRIENAGALAEMARRSRDGESCLVLAEHYSNFDYPLMYRLVEKHPELGPEVARSFLPIQGMKLSESSPDTAVFTHSYDTIVIYPSRSLDTISDPAELAEVRKISVPINHAAMREMIKKKHQGRMITVFPSGTRYRPWAPDSKKGVREIHSYMKTFDNVIFLSINGNCLPPHESNDMSKDIPTKDLLVLRFSDIVNGRSFRKKAVASTPEGKDSKQHVVDEVMRTLEEMHLETEEVRRKELDKLGS